MFKQVVHAIVIGTAVFWTGPRGSLFHWHTLAVSLCACFWVVRVLDISASVEFMPTLGPSSLNHTAEVLPLGILDASVKTEEVGNVDWKLPLLAKLDNVAE